MWNPSPTLRLSVLLFASLFLLSACNNDDTGKADLSFTPPSTSTPEPEVPDTEDPAPSEPSPFAEPLIAVEETRQGIVYHHHVEVESTSDKLAITIMEPTAMEAGASYPLILHGHGYGGQRNKEADGFQQRLRDEGYYVISIDQRGFGESSGTVRVMSPDYEGQNLIALLDWAENLPGLARFADTKMVVGSYGGSYGGMYQYLLAAADPEERLRVIAPDITPYDLSYSLSSHNVPKSFWAAGLAAMGELSPFGSWADDFPEGFIKFWQRELIENTTNQDLTIVESLLRGLVAGKLSDNSHNMLEYHSLKYFCEGKAAGPQDGFLLGQADPMRVLPKPLPAIDALISQGINDTLFNFNEAVSAYECLGKRGGDVRLITHQSGHILPLAPDMLPDWDTNMDWMYAMFHPPEFQQAGGSEDCGAVDRFEATFAWFEEKLKHNTGLMDSALPTGNNVCLSLSDEKAIAVERVKKGGTTYEVAMDTPAVSGPIGVLASMAGSLPMKATLQSQTLFTVPKDSEGMVLAGIPVLNINLSSFLGEKLTPDTCFNPLTVLPVGDIVQGITSGLPVNELLQTITSELSSGLSKVPVLGDIPVVSGLLQTVLSIVSNITNLPGWALDTVDDALPIACDPIYFTTIAKRSEGNNRWHPINGQVTPLRGYGQKNIELNGIATELNPGDEVALLIMGGHLQYPLSFSRDLLTVLAKANGSVELPLLNPDEITPVTWP